MANSPTLAPKQAIALGHFAVHVLKPAVLKSGQKSEGTTVPNSTVQAALPQGLRSLLPIFGQWCWLALSVVNPSTQRLMQGVADASREDAELLRDAVKGLYAADEEFQAIAEPLLSLLTRSLNDLDNDPIAIATQLSLLGDRYHYQLQREFNLAEILYRKALRLQRLHLGLDHPDTITSLNQLAILLDRQGRPHQALPLYRTILAHCQQQLGPQHPSLTPHLHNLAYVYFSSGQFDNAAPLYQRLLDHYQRDYGPAHPATQDCQLRLLQIYRFTDQPAAAEEIGLTVLDQLQRQTQIPDPPPSRSSSESQVPSSEFRVPSSAFPLRPDHPWIIQALRSLVSLYESMGQAEKTEAIYRALLKIYNQQDLRVSLGDRVEMLHRLGRFYQTQGRWDEAQTQYQTALDLQETQIGSVSVGAATSWLYLADLCRDQNNPMEAEHHYHVAIALLRETDANPVDLALAYTRLSLLYRDLNQDRAADLAEQEAQILYDLG